MQLTWDALVQSNGTPVPDLAGYKLYYGSQSGQYQTVILVGLTTTYTLSLLSGNVGYTYGTSLWNATDADIPAWKAFRGATYMQYLHDFFAALDGGRLIQPRHELITNRATRSQERMLVGASADGLTYTAFLPNGGTISLDLTALAGTTLAVSRGGHQYT